MNLTSPPFPITYPLLQITDKEDIFGFAYTLAIIGSAGYNFGRDHLDRDSEDLYVRHRSNRDFVPTYKRLCIQSKCTYFYKSNSVGFIPFKLKRKNYDDLRATSEPHILVVVTVPREMNGCAEFGTDHLLLKHRAYWMSLSTAPEISDLKQASVTVQIPINQEFTVESLHQLMAMIAQGRKP